jgi:hypothetical protein
MLDIFGLLNLWQITELFEWQESSGEAGWPSTPAESCDGTRAERGIGGACCLNKKHKPAGDEANKSYSAYLYPHRVRQRSHRSS